MNRCLTLLLIAFSVASGATEAGWSDRLIVKLRPGVVDPSGERLSPQAITALSTRAGFNLEVVARASERVYVLRLPKRMELPLMAAIARGVAAADEVEYAEPDARLSPMRTPGDPLYGQQWNYHAAVSVPGGANLPGAWEVTTGDPTLVVAVVDTGWLPHTDLAGRGIPVAGQPYPYGYDFISDTWTANDGGGRDADPRDPGDWVTTAESNSYPECARSDSSWHGTHVTGTFAAGSDNGIGVAGVDWQARILPVRALGKCGGFTSDIAAAIRWAAGGAVPGAPANAHPARVINLSLGGSSSCPQTLQDAIDFATSAGAVVVAAAGNGPGDVADFTPANCTGAIAVAAADRAGYRTGYTNTGTAVALTAPGGRSPANPEGVLSLLDGGTRSPLHDNAYGYHLGTSMATPHVSGTVSLMLAAHAAAGGTTLTAAQVREKLRASARPFPAGSGCTASSCGAGLLDAAAAVRSVSTPPVADAGTDQRLNPGEWLFLNGGASTDDGSIVAYQWRQTDLSGVEVALAGADTRQAKALIPSGAPLGSRLTFKLTVTDDVGLAASDSTEIRIAQPLLAPIGDRVVAVGERLTFRITAVQGSVSAPLLSVMGLPAGARFDDQGDGTGWFDWKPASAGIHELTFLISDGGDSDSERITISVLNPPTPKATEPTEPTQASGGGGALSPLLFLSLLACGLRRTARSHKM